MKRVHLVLTLLALCSPGLGAVAQAAQPTVDLCDDVEVKADEIVIDFVTHQVDATDNVVFDVDGTIVTGSSLSADVPALEATVGAATIDYSGGTNCPDEVWTMGSDDVDCDDCGTPTTVGDTTTYPCNKAGGCGYEAGLLKGKVPNGGKLKVVRDEDGDITKVTVSKPTT